MKKLKESAQLGALFNVGAFFFITVQGVFANYINRDYSGLLITFYTSLIASLFIIGSNIRSLRKVVQTNRFSLQVLRAIVNVGTVTAVTIALVHLPIVETGMLMNITPMFVLIISWLLLKEKIPFRLWCAIFIAFFGVLVIANPFCATLNIGAIYALLGAACSATAIVTMRLLAKSDSPQTTLFYLYIVGALVTAPILWFEPELPRGFDWLYFIAFALSRLLAQACFYAAYKRATPASVAPLNFSGVLFGGFFGYLLFDQIPSLRFYFGGLFIVCGFILTLVKRRAETP